MTKILGIAGGSGTGKSTICETLIGNYPDVYELIGLDNYQRLQKGPGFPTLGGMPNWDHPDVVDWQKLRADIQTLRGGTAVRALVWRHRSNPDFHLHKQFKEITLRPKPVIVVEGHLALSSGLADLYDTSIFLDLDEKTRLERRMAGRADHGFIGTTDAYMTQVLAPMHAKYVEPAKDKADVVMDMAQMSVAEAVLAIHAIAGSLLAPENKPAPA